ncbi:MAG: hypothetical protein ABIE07_03090 [Candidatus Zixiibacteriota bacterium]
MLRGVSEFIKIIIDELNTKPCPDNEEMNIWDMVVYQIKKKDSIEGVYYDLTQNVVNDNISKLKNEEIIIWKETESGINRDYEPEDVPIDSLKLDLEEEIMDEITNIAWHEIENHTLH